MIRYPAPLQRGDRIGVTSPSSGVNGPSRDRIDFCVNWLRRTGYDVVIGNMMDGSGITSGPAQMRAAELTTMLCDQTIKCVIPPWGGETGIDLVDLLDWDALTAAEPTWLVGFSDISAILLPLTTRLGWATIHGDNLADTPYGVPDGLLSWRDLASHAGPHRQRDSGLIADWWRFEENHEATSWKHAGEGRWTTHGVDTVRVSGRLIGGCIETLANLAGTPFGDVAGFGREHDADGLIVYLEAASDDAAAICRNLHGMRHAGWFEHATAILIGRTRAPDFEGFSQRDAVLDALGHLDVPLVFDLEIGHVPPHLPLINGAQATLTVDENTHEITQWLS